MGALRRAKAGDVGTQKVHAVISQHFGTALTERHDIALAVNAPKCDRAFLVMREKPVDGKGEICLAATEIAHREGNVGGQCGADVAHHLQKSVDLTVLWAHAVNDPSAFVAYAEILQKGNGARFIEDVLFHAVVLCRDGCGGACRVGRGGTDAVGIMPPAVARYHDGAIALRRQNVCLTENRKKLVTACGETVGRHVFVQCLAVRAEGLLLETRRAGDPHRRQDSPTDALVRTFGKDNAAQNAAALRVLKNICEHRASPPDIRRIRETPVSYFICCIGS